MADISKCEGTNCTLKENCYRFTAISTPYRQSYFLNVPFVVENGVLACEYFWRSNGVDNGYCDRDYMVKLYDL